jgi:hypothetical protein
VEKRINFHTIGDSHARPFTWAGAKVDGIELIYHWLGPMTCAWFGIEKPIIEVQPEDWVCFCFGEIDCRDHVGKHENWKEVVDKIAENYFETIKLYKAAKIFVFNVVPANIQATAAGDPWPCVGTDNDRLGYARYMNDCFRAKCLEYGFFFFDVYDKYADQNGFFNLKYRDDCGHIADAVFLREFLNGIINE